MSRLTQRLENLNKALARLEYSVNKIQMMLQNHHNYQENDILDQQDSVIKRFEICYELLWKSLKDLLEQKKGAVIPSPRKVFTECFAINFITTEEMAILLDMGTSRNATTHDYGEEMADEIREQICNIYYPTMQAIINRLANQ